MGTVRTYVNSQAVQVPAIIWTFVLKFIPPRARAFTTQRSFAVCCFWTTRGAAQQNCSMEDKSTKLEPPAAAASLASQRLDEPSITPPHAPPPTADGLPTPPQSPRLQEIRPTPKIAEHHIRPST